MAINEVFQNPTVSQVIFQVRFPNLFYIEQRMGDIQVKIMKEFPNSQLLIRRNILLGEVPQASDKDAVLNEAARKIWKFVSNTGVELHIATDSLDLTSTSHKTYNNPGHHPRFRDAIKLALDAFISIAGIPIITRIGLRYVDACPVPSTDPATFREWYNTSLPLDRFPLSDSNEALFKCSIKRGEFNLQYSELFQQAFGKRQLVLDFDGFSEMIDPGDCLKVTDKLHDLISAEYEKVIREPVYDYMRKARG